MRHVVDCVRAHSGLQFAAVTQSIWILEGTRTGISVEVFARYCVKKFDSTSSGLEQRPRAPSLQRERVLQSNICEDAVTPLVPCQPPDLPFFSCSTLSSHPVTVSHVGDIIKSHGTVWPYGMAIMP